MDARPGMTTAEIIEQRALVLECPREWDDEDIDTLLAEVERLKDEVGGWQSGAETWEDRSEQNRQRAEQAEAALARVRAALINLLNRHVRLVSLGDCGDWDVEEEAEVMDARAALEGRG